MGVYLKRLEKYIWKNKKDRRDEPDAATSMVGNNILFCYEEEKHARHDLERKQHFLQHKGKHSNNKQVYTDGSKRTGRKVGFAAVFTDITRKGGTTRKGLYPYS